MRRDLVHQVEQVVGIAVHRGRADRFDAPFQIVEGRVDPEPRTGLHQIPQDEHARSQVRRDARAVLGADG